MRQLALAAMALLLAAGLGCGKRKSNDVSGARDTSPAPEVTTSAAPEATGAADFSFDQRQQFTESVRQQLAGIDAEIKQLASQAKSKGGAVSDQALARIRSSRQAVSRDLKKVEAATAANWEQVRSGVTRSVENLEETIGAAQPK
jgi:hypothetical protein